ncbi:sensor histidine kinase [Luteolibacter sp. GHJ8]|uniref:histidine kinase n=1 Tax=Luteolibacter rhizosphaerae TaxID=2989719 RepID=A0ABT3G322_9BACT|nr:sensor histidine kinase [Luteolibacter rhizosphaerae]MCW1914057.1 sensor histidine kinase [Luteolibacter rhizosphaerae]
MEEANAAAMDGSSPAGLFTTRSRPWAAVVLASLMILIIGSIDFQVQAPLSITIFYLLPVLLVSRHAGFLATVICALAATLMSLVANYSSDYRDGAPWVPYGNAALRLGVMSLMIWLVRSLRALNDSLDQRVRDRTSRLQAEVKARLKLENRIIEARESEQARIGQDLHDGLCQHLVATAFSAGMLQRKLQESGTPGADDAGEIVSMIDESITQARDLAKGLYPVPLEEEGLETALRALAANTEKRTGVKCVVTGDGPPSQLPIEVAIHLYRIAQEALNNALKHAEAERIEIRLESSRESFDLMVEDDGRGINADESNGGGMGLHIMEYRARAIEAALSVSKGKTGGTRIRCVSTGQPESDE